MLTKLRNKINKSLLAKIIELKKINNIYEKRISENNKMEQHFIDKINILEDEIRQLSLKLSKEDRECWLKERNQNEKRNTPKEK